MSSLYLNNNHHRKLRRGSESETLAAFVHNRIMIGFFIIQASKKEMKTVHRKKGNIFFSSSMVIKDFLLQTILKM
jgi:hypothetical protein